MSNKLTTEEFITKSKLIHDPKRLALGLPPFSYTKVKYITAKEPVCITCTIHRDFWQIPNNNLSGKGCIDCGGKRHLTHDDWLKQISSINPDIIFLTEYISMLTPITCECKICHHIWKPKPSCLKLEQGCPVCANYIKHTQQQVEEMIYKVNPNITILGEYQGDMIHIEYSCNVCGLIHTASPSNLKQGYGCPACRMSKGELLIQKFLTEHNIKFIMQMKFAKCKNICLLKFDFYLPELNILIEFDGEQHYRPIRFRGMSMEQAIEKFHQTQLNDAIKNSFCLSNDILLIRIPYWDLKNIPVILESVFV